MKCINRKELDLIKQYRLLWNQHSEWTRMAINAITLMLPNEQYEVDRLLQNPVDFGEALAKYYGIEKASKFTDLLTEHLTLAADMIKAMMAGDYEEAEMLEKQWYENGDQIAKFLGCINPYYWSYKEWRNMFFIHLRYVQDLAVTMLNHQYKENINIYDRLELEALEMADMMSYGIIKQFPRRFC